MQSLSTFGFGFICVGSIMPEPRYGNLFPRLVRHIENESIADSMGVPSKGRAFAVQQLRSRIAGRVPIFANVGGFSAESVAAGVLEFQPFVDAIEVSQMCPNVLKPGEIFDEVGMLRGILELIGDRKSHIVVRVPNDTTQLHDRFAVLVEIYVAARVGLESRRRSPASGTKAGNRDGHAAWQAMFEAALENVERATKFARGRVPIKGNGGISRAADVLAMRRAGAVCVDLYSAFVYQGWTVARDINRGLVAMLDRSGRDTQACRMIRIRPPRLFPDQRRILCRPISLRRRLKSPGHPESFRLAGGRRGGCSAISFCFSPLRAIAIRQLTECSTVTYP